MDIVSRLKKFISHLNIPVTQFADTCGIPRPTLSQLLNGRNKKVSDEFIGKIHDAYPSLSVLWLMFGEGDMLHDKNIATSEPQTGSIFDFNSDEDVSTKEVSPRIDFNSDIKENEPDNFSGINESPAPKTRQEIPQNNSHNSTFGVELPEKSDKQNTITFSADQHKKIVNIIVYYNDNSFESFVPNPHK